MFVAALTVNSSWFVLLNKAFSSLCRSVCFECFCVLEASERIGCFWFCGLLLWLSNVWRLWTLCVAALDSAVFYLSLCGDNRSFCRVWMCWVFWHLFRWGSSPLINSAEMLRILGLCLLPACSWWLSLLLCLCPPMWHLLTHRVCLCFFECLKESSEFFTVYRNQLSSISLGMKGNVWARLYLDAFHVNPSFSRKQL